MERFAELPRDRRRQRRPRAAAELDGCTSAGGLSRRSPQLGAPVNHYKVCSTLDSLADGGSIGRAIDIGAPIFSEARRRCGLAAARRRRAGDRTLSGVRQSVCCAHGSRLPPRPPSGDAASPRNPDGRGRRAACTSAKQTARPIGLVDFVAMKSGAGLDRLRPNCGKAGRSSRSTSSTMRRCDGSASLIWGNRRDGSSPSGRKASNMRSSRIGAPTARLRRQGPRPPARPSVPDRRGFRLGLRRSPPLQIEWAEANGFDVDPARTVAAASTSRSWRAEIESGVEARAPRCPGPLAARRHGAWPARSAIAGLREKLSASQSRSGEVNARIGAGLGEIVGTLVARQRRERAARCPAATRPASPCARSAPTRSRRSRRSPPERRCAGFSRRTRQSDGFEIALKGGQMGGADFFGSVRAGRASS